MKDTQPAAFDILPLERLRSAEEELDVILQGIPDGITVLDKDGKILYANEAAAALIGYSSVPELISEKAGNIVQRFRIMDEDGVELSPENLPGTKAVRTGESSSDIVQFEVRATGQIKWSRVKATPIFDHGGKFRFVVSVFRDITTRRREEDARRFLLKAGELLTSSLDYEATLERLAELVVPRIADWCAVHMKEGKEIRELAVAHKDPLKLALAKEIGASYPVRLGEKKSGIAAVVRTGKSELYTEISPEMIEEGSEDPKHKALLKKIGLRSIMITPLCGRSEPLGALIFGNSESHHLFDAQDLFTAEELGRLAGLAVENAKLYKESEKRVVEMSESLEALKQSETNFRLLAEAIPHMVWTAHADGRTDFYNKRWFEFAGIKEWGAYIKDDLDAILHPEDILTCREKWLTALASGEDFEGEYRLRRGSDNTYRWHLTRAVPLKDAKGIIIKWFGTCTDIHDQKMAESRARHQAFHDPLTDLNNRVSIEEKIELAIRSAEAEGGKCAVLFLDLDRFKVINDTLGHRMGDLLLKEVAHRLETCISKKDDTVARIGGDEFTVLLTGITSPKEAVRVARKILGVLEPSIKIENHAFHVSASIGISFYPNDGQDVHALLKNADLALYRAKEYGRNRYQMYDEAMNQQATRRMGLENDLRNAIKNREIIPYYQPIIDLKQNNIMEVETLLRWPHPKYGMLAPADFIPVAEETGIIIPMGKYVLARACAEFKSWQDMGLNIPKLALNLSPRQFSDPQLVENIASVIRENKLDPTCLDIEITESTAMESIDRTTHKLRALKHMGLSITIDDFGTGYSSLNYLKRFPLTKIKIDKSFVKNAVFEDQDATIIKTIISIGHTLNLKVVAEGVETAKQVALLSNFGCDKIQGYFVSPALPYDEMTKWLRLRTNELFKTGNKD